MTTGKSVTELVSHKGIPWKKLFNCVLVQVFVHFIQIYLVLRFSIDFSVFQKIFHRVERFIFLLVGALSHVKRPNIV